MRRTFGRVTSLKVGETGGQQGVWCVGGLLEEKTPVMWQAEAPSQQQPGQLNTPVGGVNSKPVLCVIAAACVQHLARRLKTTSSLV